MAPSAILLASSQGAGQAQGVRCRGSADRVVRDDDGVDMKVMGEGGDGESRLREGAGPRVDESGQYGGRVDPIEEGMRRCQGGAAVVGETRRR